MTQLCSIVNPSFRKERREVKFGRGVMLGMIVDVCAESIVIHKDLTLILSIEYLPHLHNIIVDVRAALSPSAQLP